SPGVKRGGTVNTVTHSVEVICSPEDIPESIDVDVSGLEINYSKHLSEVTLPSNVRVVGTFDHTLVTIVPPSVYAEEMKAAAEAAPAAAAGARARGEGGAPPEGAARGAAAGAARAGGARGAAAGAPAAAAAPATAEKKPPAAEKK